MSEHAVLHQDSKATIVSLCSSFKIPVDLHVKFVAFHSGGSASTAQRTEECAPGKDMRADGIAWPWSQFPVARQKLSMSLFGIGKFLVPYSLALSLF
jgi:hypothetical protein